MMSINQLNNKLRKYERLVYIPGAKYNGMYFDELTPEQQREYCELSQTDRETYEAVQKFIYNTEEANMHFICYVNTNRSIYPDSDRVQAVQEYVNVLRNEYLKEKAEEKAQEAEPGNIIKLVHQSN